MGVLLERQRSHEDFIRRQAEAFLDHFTKDLERSFEFWCKSKDLGQIDRAAVYRKCLRLIKKQG